MLHSHSGPTGLTRHGLPVSPPATLQTDGGGDLVRPGVMVVVAAFNEAARIGRVLDELLEFASGIVVVDDGSADGTAAEILQRPVWLLRHPVNLGQGAALQTGLTFSLRQGAQYLVTFDADGQHDPADIPRLLAALQENQADYALGSRFLGCAEGIPATRRALLWCAARFTNLLSGVRLTDAHNGLRAMTRRGAEQLCITLNRMEHASQIIDQVAASGLKYIETPVRIRYSAESLRKGQRSSEALRIGLKLLVERTVR